MHCFISYDAKEGKIFSDQVRDIVLKNNVNPFDAFDVSVEDVVLEGIYQKIQACDIFVAIVNNLSPSVFFEIGIASGLYKPIFIVLSKEINTYPSFLNDFLYVKASLEDIENIDFAFKQLLKSQSKKKSKSNKKRKRYLDETLINSKLNKKNLYNTSINLPIGWKAKLQEIRKNGTAVDLEKYIAGIFASLRTTSKMVEQDDGIDFALWLDDMSSISENPVLIEAKYGNITSAMLNNGENLLNKYLLSTKNKVGLLLYLDKSGKRFSLGSSLSPLVLRIDLEDFLSDVESNRSITKTILDKRNEMAHGKEIR